MTVMAMSVSRLAVLAPDCGAPGVPDNGAVWLSAKNQVANFTCAPGYQLEGNITRVCQRDGEWSGQIPLCIRESGEELV